MFQVIKFYILRSPWKRDVSYIERRKKFCDTYRRDLYTKKKDTIHAYKKEITWRWTE